MHEKWIETSPKIYAQLTKSLADSANNSNDIALRRAEDKSNSVRQITRAAAYARCIISCLSIVVNKISDYILIAIVRIIEFRAKDKFICANNFSAVARSHRKWCERKIDLNYCQASDNAIVVLARRWIEAEMHRAVFTAIRCVTQLTQSLQLFLYDWSAHIYSEKYKLVKWGLSGKRAVGCQCEWWYSLIPMLLEWNESSPTNNDDYSSCAFKFVFSHSFRALSLVACCVAYLTRNFFCFASRFQFSLPACELVRTFSAVGVKIAIVVPIH